MVIFFARIRFVRRKAWLSTVFKNLFFYSHHISFSIAIKIFEVSISYRVVPSREGAAHRQLSIDKTRLVMLTWDTPEQTTLSGDIQYMSSRLK